MNSSLPTRSTTAVTRRFAICRAVLVVVMCVGVVSRGEGLLSSHELVARKKVLAARLDSLEMAKQTYKQRGESLDALEQRVMEVKDSVEQIRRQISTVTGEAGASSPQTSRREHIGAALSRIKPVSAFDWVLIGVGVLAVLSGIALLFGVIHTLLFGKHRRLAGSRSVPRPSTAPSSPPPSSVPQPHSTPSVPPAPADIDDRGIESLRQRMHGDIARIRRFDQTVSPFGEHPPINLEADVARDEGGDMRVRVLAAARQGLNVHEISRRFHMSVDQVALILRVAGRE